MAVPDGRPVPMPGGMAARRRTAVMPSDAAGIRIVTPIPANLVEITARETTGRM